MKIKIIIGAGDTSIIIMLMRQKVYSHEADEGTTTGRSCIVLIKADQQCPGHLLGALSRRGFTVQFAFATGEVFVCLAKTITDALVIIDPRYDKQTLQLYASIKRYFPKVACWQYKISGDGKGRLTQFGVSNIESGTKKAASDQPVDEASNLAPAPATQHTALGGAGNLSNKAIKTNPLDQPLRITQEELDMLLGPLPDPEQDVDDGL